MDHKEAAQFEDRQRALEQNVADTAAAAKQQTAVLTTIERHLRRLVLIVAVVGVGWLLSMLRW